MIEILIAIILQIATIVGGDMSEQAKAEQKAKEEKAKKEQPASPASAADGGAGNWND